MSQYRSSTGALDRFDEPPPRGGGGAERWDRDRFERMRRGGGGGGGSVSGRSRDDHDHFRFQEHDRFPGGRRDIDFHEDIDRRGPRVMERERFREEDRFERPSRGRGDFFNEPTPSEVANQALAPYRRQSIAERHVEVAPKRPARPGYIRRQSSLDTFDRRPLPRYGDMEEWRPPVNVPIPLPIRERRRSPPRYHEDEYEEVRYTERERDREPRRVEREEYREVEVERAKSRPARSHAAKSVASVAQSARSSSASSFEEIQPSRSTWGKRGKTRLPKRLCKRQAVIELGYPFEEEDDFVIITRALEKDHIDEIIKVSESYKETKTTYVYEAPQESFEPPPPPPPPEVFHNPPPPPSVHSHHAPPPPPSMHFAPPPPPSVHAPPPPPAMHAPPPPQSVHYAQSMRSHSPPREEFYEERIEESNHIGGPLTVLVPEDRHRGQIVRREREVRSERDIKDEIRQLESERQLLRYEREGDYEIVERRERPREVVRVDKDRKARRKEPNSKLVAAMMATLS